jgi:AcrR family transcriptional regulator
MTRVTPGPLGVNALVNERYATYHWYGKVLLRGQAGGDVSEAKRRRDEYSQASRRALLDSARTRFTVDGFAATSLDAVAADARMTKGAIYHHFANKQALFEAVLEELELETVTEIAVASAGQASFWDGVLAGLDCFLDRCLDPPYQRLCFQEGPVALGYVRWYEGGEKHELGLIRAMAQGLRDAGLIDVQDLDMLTQVLFGSMCAAALAIARADDPHEVRNRLRDVIVRMITGLRPAAVEGTASPASRRM